MVGYPSPLPSIHYLCPTSLPETLSAQTFRDLGFPRLMEKGGRVCEL